MLLLYRGGWFLAVFGLVQFGVLFCPAGIADKTLGLSSVVLYAPVTLLLELFRRSSTAHTAFLFRNRVFDAPPSTVRWISRCGSFGFVGSFFCGWLVTGASGNH